MSEPKPSNLTAFLRFLDDYTQPFTLHGKFEFYQNQALSVATRGVPDLPGVYVIFGRRANARKVLDIGKSGTMTQDGTFMGQTLRRRLTRGKQGYIPRREYFPQQILQHQLDALVFYWYATFTDSLRILPAKAEADLLQAYFDIYARLPPWNLSI